MKARMLAGLLGGGVLWAFGVVGCGGSKSDGAGDKDQFLTQLCAEFADCCEAAGRPSDGAQCRAFYGAFTSASGYDQTAADACLREVRGLANKCEVGSAGTPSCRKVFTTGGTKAPGDACEDDDECAAPESGRVECVSDFVDGATVQQCQVQLPGKAGSAPCVGTIKGNVTYYSGGSDGILATGYLCDLADGLSCDSQTGACKSLAAIGEPCFGSDSCVADAFCAFSAGVCQARLALGSACQDDDECVADAYCEASGNTCSASHAVGEACTVNAECASQSCVNQKCGAEDNLALTFLCGTN